MPAKSTNATDANGVLRPIPNAHVIVPKSTGDDGNGKWYLYSLPEISESKDAEYSDIRIIGRSSPVPTYAGSGYRSFSVTFHLHATSEKMARRNKLFLWAIASLVHPQYENTYLPPRIGKFKCGDLIDNISFLLKDYSYTMSPDVAWVGDELIPLNMSLQCNIHTVYSFFALPGAKEVLQGKY